MKSILFLIFLLFNFLSYSQVRVAIKLKNNEEIKDSVKQIGERLISLKTKQDFNLHWDCMFRVVIRAHVFHWNFFFQP
jgi:hypothetical protein